MAFSHEEIYSDFHHLGKWGNLTFKYKCSVYNQLYWTIAVQKINLHHIAF